METVYLDVEKILRETPASFLVTLDEFAGEFWLPKSQIRNLAEGRFAVGDTNCTFEIPEWLASERGFA